MYGPVQRERKNASGQSAEVGTSNFETNKLTPGRSSAYILTNQLTRNMCVTKSRMSITDSTRGSRVLEQIHQRMHHHAQSLLSITSRFICIFARH